MREWGGNGEQGGGASLEPKPGCLVVRGKEDAELARDEGQRLGKDTDKGRGRDDDPISRAGGRERGVRPLLRRRRCRRRLRPACRATHGPCSPCCCRFHAVVTQALSRRLPPSLSLSTLLSLFLCARRSTPGPECCPTACAFLVPPPLAAGRLFGESRSALSSSLCAFASSLSLSLSCVPSAPLDALVAVAWSSIVVFPRFSSTWF